MTWPKNFSGPEFVPPEIWKRFGDKSIWFLDPRILDLSQFFRDRFEAVMRINTWSAGGNLSLRGFRPPATSIGALLSQHKFGRAIDFNIDGYSPDEIRQDIFDNEQMYLRETPLTTIESGEIADTWVHADIRSTGLNEILVVKP